MGVLSLTVQVKSELCGDRFRFEVEGAKGRRLAYFCGRAKARVGWTEHEIVFNSFEEQEAKITLGLRQSQWPLWFDDLKLEELSLVNVLRRKACPLVVASADGKTVYEEGTDFAPVRDAKLGLAPGACEFDFKHPGAAVRLADGSRIKEGDRLSVSWYHPLGVSYAPGAESSLSDPKVFEIFTDQVKRVQTLFDPYTWLLVPCSGHVTGWCKEAEESKLAPVDRLVANVNRRCEIIRGAHPKARVVVYNNRCNGYPDNPDPHYFANGTMKGVWEKLPKDLWVASEDEARARKSLKYFSDLGHRQIIVGSNVQPRLIGFRRWDDAATGIDGVSGFMFLAREGDFEELEAYGRAMLR